MSRVLIIQFSVFFLLMLLSAFISRCEAAQMTLARRWFEQERERRKRNGLTQVLERRGELSLAILAARTFVNIGAISLAALIIRGLFSRSGWFLLLVVEIAVLGTIYLILIETVPKLVFLKRSAEVSKGLTRSLEILRRVLLPLVMILKQLTGGRVAELTSQTLVPFTADDELEMAMGTDEEQGILENDERKMIHSIFEFGETQVREVMIPRIDITCVDSKYSPQQALEVIVKSGHSRIPVFKDKIDNIVGLLYAKDLLKPLKDGRKDFQILDLVREGFFVPETKMISELLREFQTKRMHMAVVVDEYGGTAGLITLEDILEEIVGEIRDEYDIEEDLIKVVDKRTAEVLAKMNLHDLNEELGLELPDEDFDTLGGFVYHLAGEVPEKGARLVYNDLQFTILDVRGQRVSKVRITRMEEKKAEQAPGGKKA